MSGQFQLCDVSKDAFDSLSLCGAERGLWRHRVTDRIALDLQPGLDTGSEIEARKGFVNAPEVALKLHRLRPLSGAAQIIEAHALARHDASRPRHPADSADQHHRRG